MKHTRAVRWMFPIAASAGGLLFLVALLFHWHHGPVVNRANYNRVSNGMPRAEVEAILGGRGIVFPDLAPLNCVDVHADESEMQRLLLRWQARKEDVFAGMSGWRYSTWYDGRHMISIAFDGHDDSGRVISRSYGRRHDVWWLFRKLDELGF